MQIADEHWSRIYQTGRDFRLIAPESLAKLLSFVDLEKADKAALDIGCGTGQLTRGLYEHGYQVTGLDVSATAVSMARSLASANFGKLSYFHFDIEHDDLDKLPNPQYDLIICKLVYAFIQDKPVFLKRVQTLLAPSGTFAVITPLSADVPSEKRDVAIEKRELAHLTKSFARVALYKDDGLTYFVGRNR